jgi:hypothetical protein
VKDFFVDVGIRNRNREWHFGSGIIRFLLAVTMLVPVTRGSWASIFSADVPILVFPS